MSIPTLQQQQEQLIRQIRQHENKAADELARAAAVRRELIKVGKQLMLAKKSTLKQAQDDYYTFCRYFNA